MKALLPAINEITVWIDKLEDDIHDVSLLRILSSYDYLLSPLFAKNNYFYYDCIIENEYNCYGCGYSCGYADSYIFNPTDSCGEGWRIAEDTSSVNIIGYGDLHYRDAHDY